MSVTPASAVEGEAVEFTVELSLAAGNDTVLGWTTAAVTATSGDDYTAVTAGTLTIAAGDTTGTLTVSTEEDLLEEDDETFRVTITGTTLPPGVSLDTATATGTIEDDDTLTAEVTAGASTVPEGSAASFEVALTGATSTADVMVTYTVTGTATPGTDYTAPSGSLTIAASASSTTLSIQTTSDSVLDRGETLIVTLTGSEDRGEDRGVQHNPGDNHDHRHRHGDGVGDPGERSRGRSGRVHGGAVARGGERHGARLDDGRGHRDLRG